MRCLRLLPVLGLAAVAFAQDSRAAGPVGTLLQDALPPGADLVVHVPSVPKFLESALDAKFGTADSWRTAFRAQIAKWGEAPGDPARLLRGAEGLLRMADGEAVLAGFEVPERRAGTTSKVRASIFAFRSRSKAKDLQPAVDDVIAGGLASRYPAPQRDDATMGRPVIALANDFDGLWIRVEDHLVAVSDNPTALGFYFRGLERVARENKPPEDMTAFRVRVRWGRSDAPARWEGFTFLQREGVSAGQWRMAAAAKEMPGGGVVGFLSDGADVPLFPVPVPAEIRESARKMNARPLAVSLLPDGTWDVRGTGAAGAEERPVVGAASRGGWLRAIREGAIAPPFRLDGASLAAPVAAVEEADEATVPKTLAWRPATEPGELHGPAWHGPVTFLGLRIVHQIVRGIAPDAPSPSQKEAEAKEAAAAAAPPERPLPPSPEPWRPGEPQPKPGPALPPPEDD